MKSGVLFSQLTHCCELQISRSAAFSLILKFALIIVGLYIPLTGFSESSVPTNTTETITSNNNATQHLGDLEYRIKAAYLYNLSKFIQWPGEAANSQEPIDICLISGNPFNDYIYKLEQRKARGRSINIIDNPERDKLMTCEMIFIPFNARKTGEFLATIQTSNILTVGESDLFISQGGLINLNLENGRVQLTINNSKAKNHGFIISANLLEIARQVD